MSKKTPTPKGKKVVKDEPQMPLRPDEVPTPISFYPKLTPGNNWHSFIEGCIDIATDILMQAWNKSTVEAVNGILTEVAKIDEASQRSIIATMCIFHVSIGNDIQSQLASLISTDTRISYLLEYKLRKAGRIP